MAKPRIPNQRKANIDHKKRTERYAQLIMQAYDHMAQESARMASLAGADPVKPFRFSDYPLTRQAVKKLQAQLMSDVSGIILAGTSEEWKESNLVQDLVARKVLTAYVGVDRNGEKYIRYFQTNPDALKAFQERRDEGMNLSTRVWNLTEQYKTELEESISAAIVPGTSAMELAAEVKKYLKEPNKRFRRIRDKFGNLQLSANAKAYHPGRGVYRSSSRNAQRLARTEINMAYRTAEQTRWRQFDFVVGYEVKTTQNGNHVEDICDRLAGKYPKDFKFRGWHPNCICYCIPILKTEDEFWAYDPENPEQSENEITELPSNFREWVDDNRERIEAAEKRGKLPYFIRDNREDVEEILESMQYSQYRGNIFARTLNDIQTYLITRQFKGIESYEELSEKASKLFEKAVGNEVSVHIDSSLMPLDIAKSHLTELLSITKDYKITQGRLTEINLGYSPNDKWEFGVTTYIPSTGEKKISLSHIIIGRDSQKAIDNSRCDPTRIQFSLASHEGGHLLLNFSAPTSFLFHVIRKDFEGVYQEYLSEIKDLFSRNKTVELDLVSIGDYGTINGVGEFMAECFQEYRNSSHPSKYAKRVGKLIDRYFKK